MDMKACVIAETSAAARNLATEVTGLAEQAGQFRVHGVAPGRGTAGQRRGFTGPVKPLPAHAVPALVRAGDRGDRRSL